MKLNNSTVKYSLEQEDNGWSLNSWQKVSNEITDFPVNEKDIGYCK